MTRTVRAGRAYPKWLSALLRTDQWSDGRQRFAVFHPAAWTKTLPMGYSAQSAVHAQGLDYLVDGSDVSPFERALLVRVRRGDASGRQHRVTGKLCGRWIGCHHG